MSLGCSQCLPSLIKINKTGCKAGTTPKGEFIRMANISTNEISLLQGNTHTSLGELEKVLETPAE